MSTRYVWKKCRIDAKQQEVTKTGYQYPGTWNTDSYTVIGYAASKVKIADDEYGIPSGFDLDGTITSLRHIDGRQAVTSAGIFFTFRTAENAPVYVTADHNKGGYWGVSPGGTAPNVGVFTLENGGSRIDVRVTNWTYQEGTVISNVSSQSRNTYPTDSGGARKEGFWYTYLGSDSIDPKNINYPTEGLEDGQKITVSLSPSTSNQYGGTVTYLYQYRRNNGSWSNLTSTTETSASYTIPEGTTNIQFRVQASDNLGFTSTDYVTGQNAVISQMKVYVGINGVARKVDKLYIGVNGKARRVIKGYIGVNGKARKFL